MISLTAVLLIPCCVLYDKLLSLIFNQLMSCMYYSTYCISMLNIIRHNVGLYFVGLHFCCYVSQFVVFHVKSSNILYAIHSYASGSPHRILINTYSVII
jgi:hypothetical protein